MLIILQEKKLTSKKKCRPFSMGRLLKNKKSTPPSTVLTNSLRDVFSSSRFFDKKKCNFYL
jgi:hypothetical protein